MVPKKMRAVHCTAYGPPEVLKAVLTDRPEAGDHDILIKNLATTVNSGDTRIRGLAVKGLMKAAMKLAIGFRKPRKPVLGITFSGIVEQTGKNITKFGVGDRVFGMTGFKQGCYAEYLLITEKTAAAVMPDDISFEEAASIPFGATTALYFLEKAGLQQINAPGILIYGGSGAVGTAAIQIAKTLNADVTAVCSSANGALLKQLGAGRVIYYDEPGFRDKLKTYDIIFDAVGKIRKKEFKLYLTPQGKFLTVGGVDVAPTRQKDVDRASELYKQGKYVPVIDRLYPLSDIVRAHQYVDTGRKKGNVVITIA